MTRKHRRQSIRLSFIRHGFNNKDNKFTHAYQREAMRTGPNVVLESVAKAGRNETYNLACLPICDICILPTCIEEDMEIPMEDCPIALQVLYGLSQDEVIEIIKPIHQKQFDDLGNYIGSRRPGAARCVANKAHKAAEEYVKQRNSYSDNATQHNGTE